MTTAAGPRPGAPSSRTPRPDSATPRPDSATPRPDSATPRPASCGRVTPHGAAHRPAPGALHGQDGFAAGAEALAFGVLIFVLGTLVVVNAWAVVDAKFAASAAAREAVRAAVESPTTDEQAGRAAFAAEQALSGHGVADQVTVTPLRLGLERCQEIAYEVRIEVAALLLPGIATRTAPFVVTSQHREVVDPYRSGLAVTQGELPDCGF